jgi:hypothetical protein
MDFCKYKDALGKPGTGFHSFRIGGIAVGDTLVVFLLCIIISFIFKYSLLITTIAIFLLGIIVHRFFCVRTTVDKLLFPNAESA